MQQLLLVMGAVAIVVVMTGVLIPMLVGRPRTPEARAERDRALRDELHSL